MTWRRIGFASLMALLCLGGIVGALAVWALISTGLYALGASYGVAIMSPVVIGGFCLFFGMFYSLCDSP